MTPRRSSAENDPKPTAAVTAGESCWLLPAGMIGLLVWMVGGLVLEGFHTFKSIFYLEDTLRRELWVLAHAHGTLFSVLCLVIHLLLNKLGLPASASRRIDRVFSTGSWLLPLGFLLGGIMHPESDPNPLILLVPAGALLSGYALLTLFIAWRRSKILTTEK
jgi:hypothetical protein